MIVPNLVIRQQVLGLYEAGGFPPGSKTGWPSLDRLYTVSMGQWTVVTGTPNSGKSEWVDALMVNLAEAERWKFFVFSPENWPLALHHAKLIEKRIRRPFSPGPTQRMSREDVEAAEDWLQDKFFLCKPDRPDIESIINEAIEKVVNLGGHWKTGVVVDPWNQLEHHRPARMSTTEYVSEVLSIVTEKVREFNLHLWLVAHPAKMQPNKDGAYRVPTPRDISDSAHFWNKSDNCITIARDQVEGSQDVDVHVQKVRFKHVGRIGMTTLKYDRITGRYHDPSRPMADFKNQAAGDSIL